MSRQPRERTAEAKHCHQCHLEFDYNDHKWHKYITCLSPTVYKTSDETYYTIEAGSEVTADKFPVIICESCTQKIPAAKTTYVECAHCHKRYDKVYGPTSARHCSGILIESRLTCHYGSDHDFLQFTWTASNNPAETKPKKILDPICDDCVTKWLDDGCIQHAGSYDWRDPFNTNH